MKSLFAGTLACTLVLAVYGFYNSSDDVVELNPANFYPLVLQSDSLWLIEFYTPQCEDCQEHAAAWKTVATSLKGVVKVGAVDADRHKMFLGQYSFQKFPTVKIFGADKDKPEDYKGKPDIQAIIAGAMTALNILVKGRIDGETGGVDQGRQRRSTDEEECLALNYANFKKNVLDNKGNMLVAFMAKWCKHCTSFKPKWLAAAQEIKRLNMGKVHLASVDVDQCKFLAEAFHVTEIPTIMIFQKGKNVGEYYGPTTTAAIVAFAKNLFSTPVVPSKLLEQGGSGGLWHWEYVVELNDNNFKKEVLESKYIWLVLFFKPMCKECNNLETEWSAAANLVSCLTGDRFKMAAVDIDKYKMVEVPTIKIFQQGVEVAEYKDPKSSISSVAHGLDLFYTSTSKQEGSGGEVYGGRWEYVVELKDDNFKKCVQESKYIWLVLFFKPMCKECNNLETEWSAAGKQLFILTGAQVRLGAVDIEKYKELGNYYNESPTLMGFVRGQKSRVWCTGGQADWKKITFLALQIFFKGPLGGGMAPHHGTLGQRRNE